MRAALLALPSPQRVAERAFACWQRRTWSFATASRRGKQASSAGSAELTSALRSYAAATACAYVLGIGDRHLENFLLDTKTGSVILIDFGAAFGAGLLLTVPELMPVRLTRQVRPRPPCR